MSAPSTASEICINLAKIAMKSGLFAEAERILLSYLAADPFAFKIEQTLGVLRTRQKQYPEAAKTFSKLIKKIEEEPVNASRDALIASCLADWGKALEEAGQLPLAIAKWNKSVELDPLGEATQYLLEAQKKQAQRASLTPKVAATVQSVSTPAPASSAKAPEATGTAPTSSKEVLERILATTPEVTPETQATTAPAPTSEVQSVGTSPMVAQDNQAEAPVNALAAVQESDDDSASTNAKSRRKKNLKPKKMTAVQLKALLDKSYADYDAGNFDVCREQCLRLIGEKPQLAEVHSLLARSYRRVGNFAKARAAIHKALSLAPHVADNWNIAGMIAADQDSHKAAESHYRKAVGLDPTLIYAWSNLGNVLMAQDRLEDAAVAYNKAKSLDPSFMPVYANLCALYLDQKKNAEAKEAALAGLALDNNHPVLWNNYGLALEKEEETRGALQAYERSLKLDWHTPDAHYNLGNLLYTAFHRPGKAYAHLKSAVELRPDNVPAMITLAQILTINFQRHKEAVELLERARTLSPRNDDLLIILASGYRAAKEKRLEALKMAEEVLTRRPDAPEVIGLKGGLLAELGKLEEGVVWQKRAFELNPTNATLLSSLLFTRSYLCHESPEELLKSAKEYGRLIAPKDDDGNIIEPQCPLRDPDPERPLRIGFVSGDFRRHPIGYQMEAVIPELTNSRNTYFLYHTQRGEDDLTLRLKECKHQWCEAYELDDFDLYDRIVADKIDILIDLSGHTAYHRLAVFARRPAPIQATWLGSASTTGVQAIDYFLCDKEMVPSTETNHLAEAPWYLPGGYFSLKAPEPTVPVETDIPALRNGYVTFGTFNNPNKITDKVIELWGHILNGVPGSKLLLKSGAYSEPVFVENMRKRFARFGVSDEQLIIEEGAQRMDLLAQYNRLDIALDPFPYVGGCTTAEALWMSVPVLTRQGFHTLSHLGESLIHAIGMPDWIASSDQDYVHKAIGFASNLPALNTLHQGLRQRFLESRLGNGKLFAADLDEAFQNMWRTHVAHHKG